MDIVDTIANALVLAAVGGLLSLQMRGVRRELAEHRRENREDFAQMRGEIAQLRSDLTQVALVIAPKPRATGG